MYLGKKKDESNLREAHKKYCDSLAHPNETRSAYFDLDYLEAFVKDARKIAEAKGGGSLDVGLLLLRGGLLNGDAAYEKVENGALQINVALFVKDGADVYILEPGGESTGLCPKNCGRI